MTVYVAKRYDDPRFPVRALAMKGEAWIFLEDLVAAAKLPGSYFRIGEYQKYVAFVQKTTDP